MAYVYHHPSNNQELIDPRFVVGFLPRSPGFIYRPILPTVQVLDPRLGVALQCHPSVIIHMDAQRSISLRQFMAEEGLVPSPEEGQKRKVVIEKLKEIVRLWIQEVARQRDLPENVVEAASATILTFGSYGLGVHGSESDIDALCIGPWFASIEDDFFIHLYDFLKNTPEVSDIYCIKGAKVPLMRFKLEGISVDLPYARLQVMSVPENVDLLNPVFLTSIDEVSWKSISGVRVNQCILQLVPNLKNFQSLLRCIKFWAKRRGVYGNLFGFLGGVHLAILAAFVCQRSLNAGLCILVMSFFDAFAGWPWPFPVALQDGVMQIREDFNERRSWMPIRLPCTYEHCQSNITRSTFNRIKGELVRGQNITRNLLRPDFDWGDLFEPFVYQKTYPRFLKIYLSAGEKDDLVDWVGWVKSRFRSLILKLEDVQGFCDPNPTEYVEPGDIETEPGFVFYWGLNPSRLARFNVHSVEDYFWKNITNGYQGKVGKMRLTIVQAFKAAKQHE